MVGKDDSRMEETWQKSVSCTYILAGQSVPQMVPLSGKEQSHTANERDSRVEKPLSSLIFE